MKTFEDLHTKSQQIDELVRTNILSEDPDTLVITDGIIDPRKYYDAKCKILWILKEPYETKEGGGGGWDLKDVVNSKQNISEFKKSRQTFTPMIYISWSILNNFCEYSNMSYIEDKPEMLDALKSVAYINVKKLPGSTSSKHSVIQSA